MSNVLWPDLVHRSVIVLYPAQLAIAAKECRKCSVAREPPSEMAVSFYAVAFLAATALGASIGRKFSFLAHKFNIK